MLRVISVVAVGIALAACSKKNPDGLPPASEWQSNVEAAPSELPALKRPPGMGMHGGDPGDPHAGLDMGDPNDPNDPHAGLDMSNPHGGVDVTKMGLAAPDPDRPIDPSRRVAGTLVVGAKAKDRAKAGTAVFLMIKRAGPDGAPSGPPLAVEKLTWSKDGMGFELTEEQAMVAGTELTGDVVVLARYDQDSDALTKEPGDITGQARVTIPADNVKLQLDTVLP